MDSECPMRTTLSTSWSDPKYAEFLAIRWEIGYHSRRARAEAFADRLGLDPSAVMYYCTM